MDRTLNQVPADATHIKLINVEKQEDLHLIVNVVGRLEARVNRFEYCDNIDNISITSMFPHE